MMKSLKRILLNFLLVIFGLAFSLILIELGIRVFDLYRFPTHDFFQPHPTLGWSHVPSKDGYWTVGKQRIHVKINSKGLRDREYTYEKGKGTFRILVLGDSFTEGFQVPLEATFSKVLESELNEIQGDFEAINCGFSGVGTDYELQFLRREGYKYHPDLVILAFFANDIYENFRSKNILENEKAPLAYEKKGLLTDIKHFLAQNSHAYNYFGLALPKHAPFLADLLMKLGLLSYQPIGESDGVAQLHHLVFEEEYGQEWQEAWDVTQILISQLKTETESLGSSLAVVSIPFREQVYEDLWKSELSDTGMKKQKWDINKPDRILSAFLSNIGVPCLQLLADFRRAADKSELYHSEDGHWNTEGHHLAGQVICRWLVKEELVPVEGAGHKAQG